MRGIPFNNLEGSNKFGVISSTAAAAEAAEISSLSQFYWKTQEEEIIRAGNSCFFSAEVEPTSVLDTRRSPGSSTSTLSASSFGGGGGGGGVLLGGFVGGGGGSTDRASVAAVSDNNPLQKWPTTTTITNQEENSTPAATPDVSADIPASSGSSSGGGGGSRKDEWGSELQPISSNHQEIVSSGGGGVGIGTIISGGEKYGGGGGLAMEDWNDMLSENEASPSLLRWIIDDAEDPTSSAALLQGGGGVSHLHNASSDHHHQHSVGTYNAGFGIVDPTTAAAAGFGFESIGGGGGGFTNLLGGGGGVPGSGFSSGRMNFNNSIQQLQIQQQQNPSANFNTTKISSSPCFNNTGNTTNPFTVSPNHNNLLPPPGVFYHHNSNQQFEDEKPQLYNPQIMMMNQNQQLKNSSTPPFFVPLPSYQQDQSGCFPPPKRHQGMGGNPSSNCHSMQKNSLFMDSGQEHLFRKQQHQQQQNGFPHQLHLLPNHLQQRPPPVMLTKPKLDEHQNQQHNQQQQQQQQQQALVDQLFKAAELVECGNSVLAQGILARLNHQLSQPIGKPLYRAAFYFKEALLQLLSTPNSPPLKNFSPIDVVMKIGAYKSFSEISPLLQFSNFTLNQALLESLDGFDHIHIIDFDIGIGGQWASFMQEIAVKMGGAPSLKISAFASFSSNDHHKLELALTKEHLTHFANDLGISFEIDIVDLDTLDPSSWSLPIHVSEKETIAVNLPVGSSCINPSSIPALLRLVKQLSPKIVVSVDRGCDRSDLPFSHHFLQALQANSILLDSLDATNTNSETINKIERFLVQPRIESTVFQRHLCPEKLPPWRTLFASAGFSPVTFSNFTETQAECLLKRLQGRGFHVEKRQASLVLCWQRRELVSASAWRC